MRLRKQKKSIKLGYVLLLSALVSCTKVRLPDVEVCGDMVSEGAFCTHVNSNNERELSKKEWDNIRFGRISLSSHDYALIEATIQKLCYETRACTLQVKETMDKIKEVRSKTGR